MFPYITIFGKKITLYIIMALIGMFVSSILAIREVKKRGKDENEFIEILLVSAIGLFLGGHILYGITNIKILYRLII